MFQSEFHRWAFFFVIGAVVAWFYALNEWWGWLAALLLCIPAGLLSFILPSMLMGGLRQVVGDAFVTWAGILGGIGITLYGLVALDGPARVVVVVLGVGVVWGGITLLGLRMNAMRYRAAIGEGSAEDTQVPE